MSQQPLPSRAAARDADVGLGEPVPPRIEALLRRAVLDVACSGPIRVRVPVLHVGTPGGATASLRLDDDTGPWDHGLRVDVVAALLVRVRRTGPGARGPRSAPLAWLERTGDLDLQDLDAAWARAAACAYAQVGLPLVMVVVGRNAWRDPRSGVGRSWQRLRVR